MRMGRIDEALADLEASRVRYRQIDSDMVAYPLTLIGEIHSERGNLVQARALLEEAVAITEAAGGSDPARAIRCDGSAVIGVPSSSTSPRCRVTLRIPIATTISDGS